MKKIGHLPQKWIRNTIIGITAKLLKSDFVLATCAWASGQVHSQIGAALSDPSSLLASVK